MTIVYSKDFLKQVAKLRPAERRKLQERLALFAGAPHVAELRNHKLSGEWSGFRSINITGDVRAVYEVVAGGVRFVAIGTHSQLYR